MTFTRDSGGLLKTKEFSICSYSNWKELTRHATDLFLFPWFYSYEGVSLYTRKRKAADNIQNTE